MYLETAKEDMMATVEFLKGELSALRTGRASPALVENIVVDAYGAPMAVKGVASISVTDAKSLAVEPWDKSLLKAIEEGIRNSGLGINPVNDGKVIRIVMPPMTEENRRNLVKIVGQKEEEARIRIRQTREEYRTMIIKAEEDGEMPEDQKFADMEALDQLSKEFNDKLKVVVAEKEAEIMKI
jgi:ribosome recycling factor